MAALADALSLDKAGLKEMRGLVFVPPGCVAFDQPGCVTLTAVPGGQEKKACREEKVRVQEEHERVNAREEALQEKCASPRMTCGNLAREQHAVDSPDKDCRVPEPTVGECEGHVLRAESGPSLSPKTFGRRARDADRRMEAAEEGLRRATRSADAVREREKALEAVEEGMRGRRGAVVAMEEEAGERKAELDRREEKIRGREWAVERSEEEAGRRERTSLLAEERAREILDAAEREGRVADKAIRAREEEVKRREGECEGVRAALARGETEVEERRKRLQVCWTRPDQFVVCEGLVVSYT